MVCLVEVRLILVLLPTAIKVDDASLTSGGDDGDELLLNLVFLPTYGSCTSSCAEFGE